jgi:uncharacterized protein (DUF1778 family)
VTARAVQQSKSERLEARVSIDQKDLLTRAAEMQGVSLTDFVLSAAYQAAVRVVSEHEIISLTERNRQVFMAALSNPPEPNKALKRAARRYKRAIASGRLRTE